MWRVARDAGERPAVKKMLGHVEGSVPLLGLPLRRRERGPDRLALTAAATAAGPSTAAALPCAAEDGLASMSRQGLTCFVPSYSRQDQPGWGLERGVCHVFLFFSLCFLLPPHRVFFALFFLWGGSRA